MDFGGGGGSAVYIYLAFDSVALYSSDALHVSQETELKAGKIKMIGQKMVEFFPFFFFCVSVRSLDVHQTQSALKKEHILFIFSLTITFAT